MVKAKQCALTTSLLPPAGPPKHSVSPAVVTDADHLMIPGDPVHSVSVPDTYTSCSSPPPPPPAFAASSSHLLHTVGVPNEAPWERSLAPSPKVDLFAFCCFGEDRLPHTPYGLAAPAFICHGHTHTHTYTLSSFVNLARMNNSSQIWDEVRDN